MMISAIFALILCVGLRESFAMTYSVWSTSSDCDLDAAVDLVYVDSRSGSVTVTLPLASTCEGKCFKIADSACATDANPILVMPRSGDTVMGRDVGTSVGPQCAVVELCSNGDTLWMVSYG